MGKKLVGGASIVATLVLAGVVAINYYHTGPKQAEAAPPTEVALLRCQAFGPVEVEGFTATPGVTTTAAFGDNCAVVLQSLMVNDGLRINEGVSGAFSYTLTK